MLHGLRTFTHEDLGVFPLLRERAGLRAASTVEGVLEDTVVVVTAALLNPIDALA